MRTAQTSTPPPPSNAGIHQVKSLAVPAAAPSAKATPVTGFWETAALVRPGPNSVRALAAIAILAVLQWAFASLFLSVITGIGLVIVVGRAFREVNWLTQRHDQLQVRRSLPSLIGRGLRFNVTWEIENSSQSQLDGELRDVFPAAAQPRVSFHAVTLNGHGERTHVSLALSIPIRGRHSFGAVWISLRGPGGWVEVQRAYAISGSIKVMPEQFASRDELLKDRGAEQILRDKTTRTRQHGSGTEFESLHDYREGDDPRRIDWRATARIQRPVVRRFQVERHRDVMILVDCGRLMGTATDAGTKLDRAVDAGLVLARVALQSGDRCGMALYDSRVQAYLPPVSGMPALTPLADSVFDAASEFRETDFAPLFSLLQTRQAKRSLIVVISDLSDEESSQQLRLSLARLAQRHVVLFAALRTPLLRQVLREPTATLNEAAKKVVTLRLIRERHLSLQSMKHSGITVVDVDPEQLTVPLVNQFISLRQNKL